VVGVEDGSLQKGITPRTLLAVVLFKGLRMRARHFEDWQYRWGVFKKLGLVHKIAVSASEHPVILK